MICAHVIGTNVMIIRLDTKQLVAQHIPLLSCTSLRSLSERSNGFTEP